MRTISSPPGDGARTVPRSCWAAVSVWATLLPAASGDVEAGSAELSLLDGGCCALSPGSTGSSSLLVFGGAQHPGFVATLTGRPPTHGAGRDVRAGRRNGDSFPSGLR